jgi:hypothetical protein
VAARHRRVDGMRSGAGSARGWIFSLNLFPLQYFFACGEYLEMRVRLRTLCRHASQFKRPFAIRMPVMSFAELLDPGRIAVMIPVIAIIVFGGAGIVDSIIKHRERMTMIEMGIHPDQPQPAEDLDADEMTAQHA